MGAGKNKSHRKKRISKHVLHAEERRKLVANEEGERGEDAKVRDNNDSIAVTAGDNNIASNTRESRKNSSLSKSLSTTTLALKKTKNPKEASTYLFLWKHGGGGGGGGNTTANGNNQWKFNKNTQSWLLRHMYSPTKVSKHTFALLVEYLQKGDNVRVKNRVWEDAKLRAQRYKEFEKGQQQKQPQTSRDNHDDDDDDNDDDKKERTNNNTNYANTGVHPSSSSSTTTTTLSREVHKGVIDLTWEEMNEHEKRKEYKRARKVLDAFKEDREKNRS